MADLEIQGLDEIINGLKDLGGKMASAESKILREAGKMVQKSASKRAPRSIKPKKPTESEPWRTGNHMADNIGISAVKKSKKSGNKYVVVGPTRGDTDEYFYSKFAEWGSSHQKATPFMEPALNDSKSEILEKAKQIARDVIGI